jgi:hypothetical protein
MRHSDYRVDRAHAALLQRQEKLRKLLAMKDETKPYEFAQGFVYLITGRERLRIEQEAEHVAELLAMLAEPAEQ